MGDEDLSRDPEHPPSGTDTPDSDPAQPVDVSQDDTWCWVCGGPVIERHCKIICQVCGFTRDCSDP